MWRLSAAATNRNSVLVQYSTQNGNGPNGPNPLEIRNPWNADQENEGSELIGNSDVIPRNFFFGNSWELNRIYFSFRG